MVFPFIIIPQPINLNLLFNLLLNATFSYNPVHTGLLSATLIIF